MLTLQRGQFLESGGGTVAYVLNEQGQAIRTRMRVGARSLSAVEIESGLKEGDQVVISSVDQFRGVDSVLITN